MQTVTQRRFLGAVTVAVVTLAALVAAACGGSDESAQDEFLRGMVPHHEDAVAMADIALQRAERPEIRQVAQSIKQDQQREIEQMKQLLGDKAAKPSSSGMSGMNMDGMQMSSAEEIEKLKTAEPFDRAFIDAMIPHHEAAIQMARDVQGKAKDQEVKDLAAAIITAQEREIAQMREWRRQWYGG